MAVARMPGDRAVQLVEYPVPRHKRLSGTALFSGAAVIDDRSGKTVFRKIFLICSSGGDASDA